MHTSETFGRAFFGKIQRDVGKVSGVSVGTSLGIECHLFKQ